MRSVLKSSHLKNNTIDMIALSTMMSTTLISMQKIINEVKNTFPDMNFIVGGASVTGDFAKKCGANIYAENAIDAVNFLKNFIKKSSKK